MAYEMPGFSFTLVAGEDLTLSQFCGVDVEHGTGDAVLPGAGLRICGVVQNKPDEGESATIVNDGISKVQVGTTGVRAGDSVTVDADGTFIQASAGDIGAGIALKTNAPGELGTVLLQLAAAEVSGS